MNTRTHRRYRPLGLAAVLAAAIGPALAAAPVATAPSRTGAVDEAARLRLAVVDGETITLADLRASFATRHSGHGGLLVGAEVLRAVVDKAIAERLLIQEGNRMGIAEEPEFRQAVAVFRDLRLLEALEERFIKARAEPPAAEIRRAFGLLPRQLHVAILDTRERPESERALRRIAGGEPFDVVARGMSVHSSRARGGDLGWVTWGVLDPATEALALGARPGAVSGPFAAGAAFRLLKVIEEKPGEPPPFERVEEKIRTILRARRQEALRRDLLAGIRKSHPPAEDAAAVARLLEGAGAGRVAPEPPDAAVLLRTASGLEITAGRVRERARKARIGLGEAWTAAAEDALLIDEARRRIRPDAALERRLRLFRDERVRQTIEQTVVLRGLTLTDAEVRAFYEENPAAFAGPTSYHLRHIVLGTQAEAEEVRRALVTGEDFAALARRTSLDKDSAARGGDLGWTPAPGAAMGGSAAAGIAALRPGGISDVIPAKGGFSIVQVVEIRPGAIGAFEAVRHEAARRLMIRKQQVLRDAFVSRLRQKAAVGIFEPALARAVTLQDVAAGRRLGGAPPPAAPGSR